MAWSGTAASAVDLNSFLPDGYIASWAYGVDDLGNVGGYAVGPTGIRRPSYGKSNQRRNPARFYCLHWLPWAS